MCLRVRVCLRGISQSSNTPVSRRSTHHHRQAASQRHHGLRVGWGGGRASGQGGGWVGARAPAGGAAGWLGGACVWFAQHHRGDVQGLVERVSGGSARSAHSHGGVQYR